MVSISGPSRAAAPSASRRAAGARPGGIAATPIAPALRAAPDPKMNGSRSGDSCQTGTAVLASSAAVYVDSGRPNTAATGFATDPARGRRPVQALTVANPVLIPATDRIHEPTLIGEVTLNIRSMFRNRAGRPRSDTSSAGLIVMPASAAAHMWRAS